MQAPGHGGFVRESRAVAGQRSRMRNTIRESTKLFLQSPKTETPLLRVSVVSASAFPPFSPPPPSPSRPAFRIRARVATITTYPLHPIFRRTDASPPDYPVCRDVRLERRGVCTDEERTASARTASRPAAGRRERCARRLPAVAAMARADACARSGKVLNACGKSDSVLAE